MAASPHIVVHMVRIIQNPALPLSPPVPNIQHQTQCDSGANISAMNDINVLRDIARINFPSQAPIKLRQQ
jgi:hypothetical protein